MDDARAPHEPGHRRVRRRSTTRAELVAAAGDLFEETGSTAVSVEAVVRRAGFTRGAFYSNFRTVDDLFIAVYEDQAEKLISGLARRLDRERAVESPDLDALVHSIVQDLAVEESWYALRSVLLTRARRDDDLNAHLRAHLDHLDSTLGPPLLDVIARAGRTPTVPDRLFTRSVLAAHAGVVSQGMLVDDLDSVRFAVVKGCILGLTEPAATRPKGDQS